MLSSYYNPPASISYEEFQADTRRRAVEDKRRLMAALVELPPVYGLAAKANFTMAAGDRLERDAPGAWRGIERIAHAVQLRINHGGRASALCDNLSGELQLLEHGGDLYFAVDLQDGSRSRALQNQVRAGRFSGVSVGLTGADTTTYASAGARPLVVTSGCVHALNEISLLQSPRRPLCSATWVATSHDPAGLARLTADHPLRRWASAQRERFAAVDAAFQRQLDAMRKGSSAPAPSGLAILALTGC
jgi:phage head maturation protease